MKMFDIEKTRTEIEARKAMAFAWLRRNVRHVCDGGVLSRLKLEEVERPAVFDAAIDLCVVPTLSFERLFTFLVVGQGRRQLLWFAVTRHPTAEWLAQQIVEAFPWNTAPIYLVRDNDGAYGQAFLARIRTMGIRDHPISPRSPWQKPYAERLIGTLRRDCLDHILIFGERHSQSPLPYGVNRRPNLIKIARRMTVIPSTRPSAHGLRCGHAECICPHRLDQNPNIWRARDISC